MGKQISSLPTGLGTGIVIETLNPPAIAYKIKSSKLQPFLTSLLTGFDLIGLQIEFKKEVIDENEKSSWHDMPEPIITQLYFDNAQQNGSYFKRIDTIKGRHVILTLSEAKSVVVNQGEILEIEGETVQEPSWSSLGNYSPAINAGYTYKKFDYYKDVRLVYFSIGLLRSLVYLYDELIISGCQLNMGRKLYHKPPNPIDKKNSKIFRNDYFTLKIEGSTPSSVNQVAKKSDNGANQIMTDATGSNLVLGHPCPPSWETFLVVFGDVINCHPDTPALFTKLPNIWNDWLANYYIEADMPTWDDFED